MVGPLNLATVHEALPVAVGRLPATDFKKRDRSSFFSYNLIIGLCQNGFYENEENFTNSESQNVISLSILYISLSYGMYGNKLKIISIDEMSILRI